VRKTNERPKEITMIRIAAIGAVMVAGAGLVAMTLLTQQTDETQFAQCSGSVVASDLGGPFTLVNGEGQTVTDEQVITEPTLIYFGYTFCPDVCPLDVDRNAAAVEILEERGQSVTPVFITIDPERDTTEVVGDFAEAMHPRMIGLTGSVEQVAQASRAYRTYYKAHPPVDGEYLVDHSTFSYLVTPEHGFLQFFRRELTPTQMADQIGCFVERI
jgi:protein SCO1/2